jgi:hypothetical protein
LFISFHGVKRVTKGKKPFKIDLTPFQEWSGLVDRKHNATAQQGVFLVAVLITASALLPWMLSLSWSLCAWFVLFHQLYRITWQTILSQNKCDYCLKKNVIADTIY